MSSTRSRAAAIRASSSTSPRARNGWRPRPRRRKPRHERRRRGRADAMRIATWNCNMAFRRKFTRLIALKPDLAIIPECESREFFAAEAAFAPRSAVWIGDNPRKGLGIFTFGEFRARLDAIHRPDIPYVVPVRISGPVKLRLLAVWACHHKPNSYENRIGPLRRAVCAYKRFLSPGAGNVHCDFHH